MSRKALLKIHLVATGIAVLTISIFFSFSLIAELSGNEVLIKEVKKSIFYALPILFITMPALGISGNKLAGNSKSSMIRLKQKRMKLISFNGMVLVTLAAILYYLSIFSAIDTRFFILQVVELAFGLMNLILISKNIKSGLKLSGRFKHSSSKELNRQVTYMDEQL